MKQKRWHKLLKVCSFAIASFLLFSCFGCAKGETEKQHVRIEGSFAPMSLGDIVKESEYIAYGEVIEKGPVTTPEYASDHDYGKDVTVRVKKGLLNCEEGDTVVYWELGGEAPNGIVYEHPGLGYADGYQTTYANLQEMPPVAQGDTVTAGQVIGAVGTTAPAESAQGPHLHFSVSKDGDAVDPDTYLNG